MFGISYFTSLQIVLFQFSTKKATRKLYEKALRVIARVRSLSKKMKIKIYNPNFFAIHGPKLLKPDL